MRKLNIFVSDQDVEAVMRGLGDSQVIDLAKDREVQVDLDERPTSRWRGLENQYSSLQRRVNRLAERLEIELPPASIEEFDPHEDYKRIDQELAEIEEEVEDLNQQINQIVRDLEDLDLLVQGRRFIKPLDVEPHELLEPEFIHLIVGTLPSENLASLQMSLFRIPYVVLPVHEYEGEELVFAACAKEHAPVLELALQSVFLSPIEINELIGRRPEATLSELTAEVDELESKRQNLKARLEQIGNENKEELGRHKLQISRNLALVRAIEQLGREENIYLVAGWVPERDTDRVVELVRDITEDRAEVQMMDPAELPLETVPSVLHNPAWLKPFENILTNFGSPGYREIDPTPVVALTFIAMFGMMFGDVGHGLVLALFGLWWSQRSEGPGLGGLMIANGLSSMVFGFLYGSLFGREDILHHLWLSPMENILTILGASVLAGVFLLSLGLLLNIWIAARNEAWGELFFGYQGLAGLFFYLAAIGGVLALTQGVAVPGGLLAAGLIAPALLMILHEPLGHVLKGEGFKPEEPWNQYLLMAPFELFETVISYLSNSLSFVRLGAFAIAHAGLSRVVFILADQASGPLRWLVIIFGNLLIIGFEGLVVSIQTLRLEYYEFFGKFFEGRARPFEPFTLFETERTPES